MSRVVRYTIIFICVVAIVSIRLFENNLFYDPLFNYFKSQPFSFDEVNIPKHIFSISMRYIVNNILVLILIFLLFNSKHIRFSLLVLSGLGVLLLTIYSLFLYHPTFFNTTFVFYVRRLLLQPLIGLLLLVALYYQEKLEKR